MMKRLVTEYLEETAAKYPDKVAFAGETEQLTFGELRHEARNIASCLAKHGLWHQPVAVYLEKSPRCIAAFMGAAYSGNFYTPLDTKMPSARINKIMQTLEPSGIVTDRAHAQEAEAFAGDIPVFLYEEMQQEQFDEALLEDCHRRMIDTDVLYVLFTSGSTGTPKGVIIGHRPVIDYIEWVAETFHIDEKHVLGNQAPLYFDLSIQDVYATLKTGCTTYLLPEKQFTFPVKLMEAMAEKKINTIFWVPSALCLVANLKALAAKKLPPLRKVLFCGEVMPVKQLNMWRRAFPEAGFVNLYGPTEITEVCTYYPIEREFAETEVLPVGKPCRNTDILVLNDKDEPAAIGEMGELCVRGTSLAYGYYNNPEKTAEAFVQNPLQKAYPELIYRTGDLVKYNELGELIYAGRKDFQIKHMGHRIELGEIETAVSAIEGIEENCCLHEGRRDMLVLYYTGKVTQEAIMEALKKAVPSYMLPSRRIQLEQMPHNMNGKIDRVKLKEMMEAGNKR